MNIFANLKERLDTYGPFPPSRRKIVIFNTGNDYEDHGPAMATSSDTLFAQAFCAKVALRTGIRYLAHVPFTSDLVGDCAGLFCPVYMPEPEFFEKTLDYCKTILDKVSPRPEGVIMLVPNHGERIMKERFNEFTRCLGVKNALLIGDVVLDGFARLTEDDYKDSPLKELVREGIEKKAFQHAGFFDYSIAEALGHLDREKLKLIRSEMEVDLESTLKKYPAVHNLAGYIRYGGKEFDELRNAVPEMVNSIQVVEPKWQNSCPITGRAIVRHTIDIMVETILDFEKELFG